jgi:cell division protein FtsB
VRHVSRERLASGATLPRTLWTIVADTSLTIAVVTAIGTCTGLLLKFMKDRSVSADLRKQGSSIAELREDLDTQLRRGKTFVPHAQFAKIVAKVADLERQVTDLREHPDTKDLRARIESLQASKAEADRQWGVLMREIGELSGQVSMIAQDRG